MAPLSRQEGREGRATATKRQKRQRYRQRGFWETNNCVPVLKSPIMPDSDFRIILVGGGPVGLVAAHIFAAAGIKFVLLEQRSTIVPQQGAGIVLFPHTQRVFEQLGLMDRIREIAHKFSENRVVDGWGWHYDTTYSSKWTEEKYGSSSSIFER